jgi:hypothetical protein
MRVKSGVIAAGLKFQPPSAIEASKVTAIKAPKIGSTELMALQMAWVTAVIIEPGSLRVRVSNPSELRMTSRRQPARGTPTAIRAALPPIIVAKFDNSRERGTWPRSRAWSRRRCDGSSVRSPPFSDSAISALLRPGRRPDRSPPGARGRSIRRCRP